VSSETFIIMAEYCSCCLSVEMRSAECWEDFDSLGPVSMPLVAATVCIKSGWKYSLRDSILHYKKRVTPKCVDTQHGAELPMASRVVEVERCVHRQGFRCLSGARALLSHTSWKQL
jgi:hypothetical protein